MERIDRGRASPFPTAVALVIGSAIASIHILGVRRWDLSAGGWVMVALTFTWIAMTASGPFVFLERALCPKSSWDILGSATASGPCSVCLGS